MHNATLTLCLSAAAGVFIVIAARRLNLPSIVLLLVGGILLGPEFLGLVDPESLGEGLETIVALSIAIILFEGGLTLDLEGYRKSPIVIRRLLTIGPLITWLGIGTAVFFLYDLTPVMSLMIASMVIVTGPTVVSPLLRRIRVQERIHHVLYWEGVLIDAIGVFVAVLCYEWMTPDSEHAMFSPLTRFSLRILVGIVLGISVGIILAWILKRDWVPKEHINIFVLAVALLTFGIAHALITESGILAVVIAGLVTALRHPPQLKYVKRFKLQLTELGIGTIFILLAAKLNLNSFTGWRLLVLLAIVILLVRPLVVWIATSGQGFNLKEKTFLSWIAPRGIVAAAMASLFSFRLKQLGYTEAGYLETITYAVVISTVTLQGLSAPWLAKALGLQRSDRKSWVLFGDPILVPTLGRALRKAGVKAVEVISTNGSGEALNPNEPRFSDVNSVLYANTTMLSNIWTAVKWGFSIRSDNYYRFATFEPEQEKSEAIPKPLEKECTVVWKATVSAAAISGGLENGSHSIDVVELGKDNENGRFGPGFMPLFWINKGRAYIVTDPKNPGIPKGAMAVVLKRKTMGLTDLISHVEIIPEEDSEPGFETVLAKLVESVVRQYPSLPSEDFTSGILTRMETMDVAIGNGIAIPHAYWDGVDKSHSFLAIVPGGIPGMQTPDGEPVRLVFLLVSPLGKASVHLQSLAALASLGQEADFIRLISRQRVPARIAALIKERG